MASRCLSRRFSTDDAAVDVLRPLAWLASRPSPPYPSLARQVRAFFRLYDDSDSERCRMHANANAR
ncbi:hypothetical protein PERCYII40_3505 [Pseudomonas aeruginosa]|nr:hypothetical protein PERCYII40_3505 [Pseudomonas aeruginosa]